ncbi:MAG: hypothetical protein ACD_63C00146G0003 [uncultured bacterium]|nr:MAG: hypothetical protein ACD_63C00146G0003 [uncultured bacterium]
MHKLKVKIRKDISKKVKAVREKGLVPAILYGPKVNNENLEVDYTTFEKLYEKAGSSSIVELDIGGKKKRNVLIQDVQRDPVSDKYLHIDFYQIRMDKKLEAEVELEFIGESLAVKDDGGVLVKNFDAVDVKCLPVHLPSGITVDISPLKTFDDVIKIKDLKVADKVEILQDGEEVVATVTPPRSEEELEALEEEVTEDVEAVEGVKEEEKEEGEEAEAEGEAKGEKKSEAEGEKKEEVKGAEKPLEKKKEK